MKKALPLLTAAVLFAGTVLGTRLFLDGSVRAMGETLVYINHDSRNFCFQAMEEILQEGTIPVFGSSELSSSDGLAYPRALFHGGNSDFNMIMIGRGHTQSLHHAVNAGAMAELLPDQKAVLIVSPQWFTEDSLTSSSYPSRFSERMFARFLRNGALSRELRSAVAQRAASLMEQDPQQLARLESYDGIVLQHSLNPVEQLGQAAYDHFMETKAEFTLCLEGREWETLFTGERVRAEELDFDALRAEAVRIGEASCTNNDFYINDDYYTSYIVEKLAAYKGAGAGESYASSPEYSDLKTFLKVCRETGVRPLVVSVPVNGWWYDYWGFPKEDREAYYQNIRDICGSYGVALADFSDREYEPYFLKDIMHLGWKGWVYVDEAVYEFYRQP